MAEIIGSLRPNATWGEQRVYELLRQFPDEYLVWPERAVGDARPDFIVLHPRLGVLVLEVKDFKQLGTINPDTFEVYRDDGSRFQTTNPDKQAHSHALNIADALEKNSRLLHPNGRYRGKLMVPWEYAVAFPHLAAMEMQYLAQIIQRERILIADDLFDSTRLERRIQALPWRFPADLSPAQIDAVRRTIFPELRVPARGSQQDSGWTLDIEQEKAAKEGLFERVQDDELSPEGETVAQNLSVRLVRGVAGSGKTLVLGVRASLLAEANPDWRILVVSYNKSLAGYLRQQFANAGANIEVDHFHHICSEALRDAGLWSQPVNGRDQVGWIRRVLDGEGYDGSFEPEFLRDEFNWMKDTATVTRNDYLTVARMGRGSRLTTAEREAVYAIFEAYERHLQLHRCFDWADVPLRMLDAIDLGLIPGGQYDAILVDEAQDFAPTWFEVLKRLVNPQTGVLFMAADSTQRIYQKFSWKSLGLHVVGRSRILRRAYRNTYEIMQTAYEAVCQNEMLLRELHEQEEQLLDPDLNEYDMRHGDYPTLTRYNDKLAEERSIVSQIRDALQNGYQPNDIAVLTRRFADMSGFRLALQQAGIPAYAVQDTNGEVPEGVAVSTLHSAKGLEYRVVFITNLDAMFDMEGLRRKEERDDFEANEMRLLYVGMTRARDRLHLSYRNRLPQQAMPLKAFLDAAHRAKTA